MSWSARRSLVSHFVEKSLLRPKSRLELGALFVGCFLPASFLACVERQAAGSDVLLRYFEFMLHNKRAFVLGFSVVALVFHYHLLASSGTEIRCRVLVGDRLTLIRLRYIIECLALLGICCALSIALHLLLGFEIVDNLCLFAVLSMYILASAGLMGAR